MNGYTEHVAKWIKSNSDLIKPKQFDHLYANCMGRFQKYAALGALSDILLASGINPMLHVDKILPGMFYGSEIKEITVPNNIKSIGINAFSSCYNLEKVTIQDNIAHIDNSAFMQCPRLKYVDLPENLVTISKLLFYGCESLETIYIPNLVISIDHSAFYLCTNLRNITYNGTSGEWENIPKGHDWNRNAGRNNGTGVIQVQCTDTNRYVRCQ